MNTLVCRLLNVTINNHGHVTSNTCACHWRNWLLFLVCPSQPAFLCSSYSEQHVSIVFYVLSDSLQNSWRWPCALQTLFGPWLVAALRSTDFPCFISVKKNQSTISQNVCLFDISHGEWMRKACYGMKMFLPNTSSVVKNMNSGNNADLLQDLLVWFDTMSRGWKIREYVHCPNDVSVLFPFFDRRPVL